MMGCSMDIEPCVLVKEEQDSCLKARSPCMCKHRQQGFPGPPSSEGVSDAATLERVHHLVSEASYGPMAHNTQHARRSTNLTRPARASQ